jgi:hypothetical protein
MLSGDRRAHQIVVRPAIHLDLLFTLRSPRRMTLQLAPTSSCPVKFTKLHHVLPGAANGLETRRLLMHPVAAPFE